MFVIVGLGNAEPKYNGTYHNVGFMAVDKVAEKYGLTFSKKKYHGLVAEGMIEGEKVILLKPTTFMNLSGVAVSDVVNQLKVDLTHLVVLYDDIDLPVGKVRYRAQGSAGTHNGMRNIVSMLGNTNFPRVRVGIGRHEEMDLVDFVLSRIFPNEREAVDTACNEVVDIVAKIIRNEL